MPMRDWEFLMLNDFDRYNFESENFDLEKALKQMALEHRPELPSPGLIWFRAQVARKLRQKQRIEQPVVIMCGLAGLACAIFLINFVAGDWGPIRDALSQGGWVLPPVFLVTIAVLAAFLALIRRSPSRR